VKNADDNVVEPIADTSRASRAGSITATGSERTAGAVSRHA
jgi:hypothetical protein